VAAGLGVGVGVNAGVGVVVATGVGVLVAAGAGVGTGVDVAVGLTIAGGVGVGVMSLPSEPARILAIVGRSSPGLTRSRSVLRAFGSGYQMRPGCAKRPKRLAPVQAPSSGFSGSPRSVYSKVLPAALG
jgi:hypothetical protein